MVVVCVCGCGGEVRKSIPSNFKMNSKKGEVSVSADTGIQS